MGEHVNDIRLEGARCVIRPWRRSDIEPLVGLADNRKVWRNLGDRFPHPYTRHDAEWWIDTVHSGEFEEDTFAIEVTGEFAGGIGVRWGDFEKRHTAEIGYWLGEPYWERGIGTEAVGLIANWVVGHEHIRRIYAHVYGWNPASGRVLEKNGFAHEATLWDGIFKDGTYTDLLIYSRVIEGNPSPRSSPQREEG